MESEKLNGRIHHVINVDRGSSMTNWSVQYYQHKNVSKVTCVPHSTVPMVCIFVPEYVAYNHPYSKTGAHWIFQGNKKFAKEHFNRLSQYSDICRDI